MPLWMTIYLLAYGLMVFFNICYLIYVRSRLLVLFYDICAAGFLFVLMLAYWEPLLVNHLNHLIIPVYILLVIIDMRMTIYGDIQELGIDIPEGMDESDMEIAGALSLFFSSPAYVVGGLMCLEMIFKQGCN